MQGIEKMKRKNSINPKWEVSGGTPYPTPSSFEQECLSRANGAHTRSRGLFQRCPTGFPRQIRRYNFKPLWIAIPADTNAQLSNLRPSGYALNFVYRSIPRGAVLPISASRLFSEWIGLYPESSFTGLTDATAFHKG
jgi:hypothetical protein